MKKYKEINIETWARKVPFDFFKQFDDPFFNITANVQTGRLTEFVKSNNLSYNLACLFFSQKVINSIPEFKMRITKGSVFEYEKVHCSTTILMPDNTFAFCYFDYTEDLIEFDKKGKENINLLKSEGGFNPKDNKLNMVHYSTIPWISFTSIKHPRKFNKKDSVPKIVLGKRIKNGMEDLLPVSVEVHHSLVDGYHLGKYFNGLQELLNQL